MTEILTGLSLAQAEAVFAAFHARVTTGETIEVAPNWKTPPSGWNL